jgi:hypothetical protein
MYAKSASIEDAWNAFCHTWRRLLNILNRLKMHQEMISLLFVFCQLVAMQVCWMKACTVMLQSSDFTISAKLEHYTCMVHLLGCAHCWPSTRGREYDQGHAL